MKAMLKFTEADIKTSAHYAEKLHSLCHNHTTRGGKDFLMHDLSGYKPALTQMPCGRASSSDIAIP